LQIVVVGSGSEMPKLCETIKRLEIEKYFDVVGRLPVSETIKYYESADAVFIPLLDNSYTSHMIPQKVIETLKLGRPILGMISGDGRKILEESGGSIFCEESVEGIYNGINELMKLSIQQKKLMGTNNYAYYKSHPEFTLEYTCDAIISEMSKIIGENN
jgi:glycosyltransferase involved in cell wall biosynthesis